MASNDRRTYSATRVLLEVDGQIAASLTDVAGGERYADVIPEPASSGRIKKHLGSVRCAPITIGFAGGIGKVLFEWIGAALAGKPVAHGGALVFLDYKGTASSRLGFKSARITEITLPAFSGTDKSPTRWEIVIQPESTSVSHAPLGTFYSTSLSKSSKAWLASSFSFTVSQLEQASARVSAVEAIKVRIDPDGDGTPDVGNVSITISNTSVEGFEQWHQAFVVDGHNGDEFERSGKIVQLAPDQKETLCTISLMNVGIIRITPDRVASATDVIARSRVELYVEAIELDVPALATFTTTSTSGGTAPTNGSTDLRTLRGAELGARLRSTDSHFLVADDLRPRQREGDAAGEAWARGSATLAELESIAALGPDWTELRLPDDHSLVLELSNTGVLVADPGPVELTRDEYVEAVVAGARRVYREALPYLGTSSDGEVSGEVQDAQLASGRTLLTNVEKTREGAANAMIDRLR